ncbi:diguanylate cyclase domain-containing protein [Micromonosporaceae bacterium Da 78-11]
MGRPGRRRPAAGPGHDPSNDGTAGERRLLAQNRVDATLLADRLVRAVAAPAVIGGHTIRVGASIGITFVSDAPTEPADLLRRADAAMYAVKSAGKNAWRISEPELPRSICTLVTERPSSQDASGRASRFQSGRSTQIPRPAHQSQPSKRSLGCLQTSAPPTGTVLRHRLPAGHRQPRRGHDKPSARAH